MAAIFLSYEGRVSALSQFPTQCVLWRLLDNSQYVGEEGWTGPDQMDKHFVTNGYHRANRRGPYAMTTKCDDETWP